MDSQHRASCQEPCHTLQLSEVGPVPAPRHSSLERQRRPRPGGLVPITQLGDWTTATWLPGSARISCSRPRSACPHRTPLPGNSMGFPSTFFTQTPSLSQHGRKRAGVGLPSHRPASGPQTPPPSQPSQTPGGRKKACWRPPGVLPRKTQARG